MYDLRFAKHDFKKTVGVFLNRKSYVVLFLLGLFFFSWAYVPEKKQSLVYALYDQQAAFNNVVHLYKVSFVNGVSSPQEKIMDITTKQAGDKSPRIRFDLGANQIYKNRYVITSYGNVIDLQDKKVLVDQHDQFIRASGDSIIFYTNDIFRGQFYSVLDLKTGQYEQVKSPAFKAKIGKDVEPDCSQKNFKIHYYPTGAAKIEIVKDAGFGEDLSLINGTKPRLPIWWINNDEFIYPKYSVGHNYVAVMKVAVSTKTEEKLGEIDQLPENHHLSRFYLNPDGDLVYDCARGHFKIDYSKKKVTELQFISVGNGFSVAVNETDIKGRAIKSGDQSIGTYFCNPEQATTCAGAIAFPYEMVFEGEHFLQGVAVWNTSTKKWKTIGDSDLSAVVGWVEE
jgi:hypothetical protein